ncbi:MAG: putative selenium-dependent hydroxylase accessory protein YqeC [Ruminococcaceae bacterium]|jgi:probable selenium-dependent hydroxylase accessory protein YqeC|nr:putative selenium-dependent hydroxylase accessory protein YqeC [Oscillospiraceae bacterium]
MLISSMLRVGRGVTALIGGGGKTTLLYALAEELRKTGTVVLCASTHILVPAQYPLCTGGMDELAAALAAHGAVCAGTPAEDGKLTAPAAGFEQLAQLADYVLVEADGSRGLPLKAHAPHEPVIPANAQRVVLVVGADGFGRRISDVCHRPGLYAERAGVSPDDTVTPELAARVIRAEGFGDRVLVNKVESAGDYAAAEELSKRLSCPVTAGSLHKGVYVCLR